MSQGETVRISAGGVTVAALRGGSGPPLVYLHGAGGGGMWWPFLERLSQRYTVYAPEHPGFGVSEDSTRVEHVSDLAYFYAELLRTLGPAHLLGESLGGWVAAETAVRDCRDIRTLTLMGPAGLYRPELPMTDIFGLDVPQLAATVFENPALQQQFAAGLLDPARREINLRNQAATARYVGNPRFHNPDLHKWLLRIRVPTLVVWGAQDRLFPAAYAQVWAQALPGTPRVAVIPGAGHLPQIEACDAFLEAFDGLLGEGTP